MKFSELIRQNTVLGSSIVVVVDKKTGDKTCGVLMDMDGMQMQICCSDLQEKRMEYISANPEDIQVYVANLPNLALFLMSEFGGESLTHLLFIGPPLEGD